LSLVVVHTKRHAKLLSQVTDLLRVCSESQADRTKVEHSGWVPLWLLAWLWLLWVLLWALGSIVLWHTLTSVGKSCRAWRRRLLRLLPLRWRWRSNLDAQSSAVCTTATASGSFCADRGSACRADLLSLEPAFEATKMQDVAAWELLWPNAIEGVSVTFRVPDLHFLPTDYAGVFSVEIFLRRIRVPVHLPHRATIPQESTEPLNEVSRGQEDITHYVNGQAVADCQHVKKRNVDAQFDHVCYGQYGESHEC
jgi:hypothetical protein